MSPLNILRWFVVVALIGVLAVPAVVVELSGRTVVEVDGQSMEPTFLLGDVVAIRDPRPADFVPGTVVTVLDATDSRYTHRIVGVEDDGMLILKGDNNETEDPAPVDPDTVVGVVDGHLSGAWATFALQLQSWPLRACLLVMIVGLIFMPVRGRRRPQANDLPTEAKTPRRDGPRRRRSTATVAATSRRQDQQRNVPESERAELLDLVDSLRSAVARVLLGSERRLGGRYTVTTHETDGFPALRVVIDITEKRDPSSPATASSPSVVVEPAPRRGRRAAESAEVAGPPTATTGDFPTRRSQREATRHGRRRAR
ncbi:signal peptidase I [Herbiconiux sp. L3-i23]|uniref:signal peptidase I n=1 Tax=Herbiconiux sp. L3-i23 TaxID=2905871 RepID=UPI002059C60C|nr:signal peptidase I [Herbiconiux sp. L3-i23]BDI23893.1 hypothetical protein L3i23_26690 [Herbiconiux sp. L3-i23]